MKTQCYTAASLDGFIATVDDLLADDLTQVIVHVAAGKAWSPSTRPAGRTHPAPRTSPSTGASHGEVPHGR